MIEYRVGDILDADVQALVNTVNCVGVMGRGIALQFKKSFPENFKAYRKACEAHEVVPGRVFTYDTKDFTRHRYVMNFPTKRHWRGKSDLKDIEAGLADLVKQVRELAISSIAIPPLGCGLGGLDWGEVRPIIEGAFRGLEEVRVILFEPGGVASTERMKNATKPPRMTAGRAALLGLMDRYLDGLLDPFVSLLEIHKLLYFLQVSGEDLKLEYKRGVYGPYSETVRHVLNRLEGHFTSGYLDGGDDPWKEIAIVPGALNEACEFLKTRPGTRTRFARVSELIDGFESPYGLELLATVHWLCNERPFSSTDDIARAVHAWNDQKRKFTPHQVEIAYDQLLEYGWVEPLDIRC
ncbi:MAG: macro domain-containing protein [Sumerlaeia bacterium]